MLRSVLSEIVRFRRTARLGAVVMVIIGVLVTVFVFAGEGPGGEGQGGPHQADAAADDGMLAGLATASQLIGVVGLALFATSVARDFELGTIRILLVAESRRAVLMAGKLTALAGLVVAGVILAAAAAAVAGSALASPNDVDTTQWGITAGLATAATVSLSTVVWGLFGAGLAILTRSSAAAITAGVAYLLIGENLLGQLWSGAGKWLPSGMLSALADGGTPDVSFAKALALVGVYAAVATLAMFLIFDRRDITD